MRTTSDNVFILPDWDREEKAGAIFLPQVRQRELPNTGVIKFINPTMPAEFRIGDRVIYDRHRQQLRDINGERLAHVKIQDVMAILI